MHALNEPQIREESQKIKTCDASTHEKHTDKKQHHAHTPQMKQGKKRTTGCKLCQGIRIVCRFALQTHSLVLLCSHAMWVKKNKKNAKQK